MPPPRFSAASADRLQDVLAAADDAVDAGAGPDAAIAKAARDAALPVGHVPLAVRAFNTGRAVRQLGAADPWAKAAAYPQATVGGVVGLLTTPPAATKTAADLTDYYVPPAAAGTRPEPTVVKAAAAPAVPPAAIKPATDNRIRTTFEAAAELDKVAAFATTAAPGVYAAVKAAAAAVQPAAAAFAFGLVEAADRRVAAKAAATPDPAVKTGNHPAVAAVARLAELRAGVVRVDDTPTPPGWRKFATGWAEKGPHNAVLGLPVPPKVAVQTPPPGPPPLLATTPRPKAAGFGGAYKSVTSPLLRAYQSDVLNPVLSIHGPSPATVSSRGMDALDAGMARTDEQAAVQDLLADPRFRTADPRTVIESFRQLHGLAPQAMQNPAVAADFIQRRLQTGPLSAFDLKMVTDLEKNLHAINKPPRSEPGDD